MKHGIPSDRTDSVEVVLDVRAVTPQLPQWAERVARGLLDGEKRKVMHEGRTFRFSRGGRDVIVTEV